MSEVQQPRSSASTTQGRGSVRSSTMPPPRRSPRLHHGVQEEVTPIPQPDPLSIRPRSQDKGPQIDAVESAGRPLDETQPQISVEKGAARGRVSVKPSTVLPPRRSARLHPGHGTADVPDSRGSMRVRTFHGCNPYISVKRRTTSPAESPKAASHEASPPKTDSPQPDPNPSLPGPSQELPPLPDQAKSDPPQSRTPMPDPPQPDPPQSDTNQSKPQSAALQSPASPQPDPTLVDPAHQSSDPVGAAGLEGSVHQSPNSADKLWDDWAEDASASNLESAHPALKDDDGGRRCRIRRPLRFCPAALQASGQDLDEAEAEGTEPKKKRKRKADAKKSDVRGHRGMALPRKPMGPNSRPQLVVVGDAEFTCTPRCSKIVTTIRILTLENMPGPYRTYNMFPILGRLEILKKFLQRYTWGEEEDVGRCLDVFENMAAEAYSNAMTVTRIRYKKKHGSDKELWKDFPPQWCKNVDHWKGLCHIWSKDKWDQMSATNRNNKTRCGHVVNHVGGSMSSFRHKQALASERGSAVGLKDVFDRTHSKDTPAGKSYVNEKARGAALTFEDLKTHYGDQMTDEELWELAVNGEDKRGRLFGFGQKSRTCKLNRGLEAEDACMSDPDKSTATSNEDAKHTYTKAEVAVIIATKIAAERRAFASEIAAREERHRADIEECKKNEKQNKACLDALFKATGAPMPSFSTGSSSGNDGGDRKGKDGGEPSNANR